MSKSYRDIFRETAWYYTRYRPGYPKHFFTDVKETFHLDGNGRLLDLGCGTGQLTLPLAPSFKEVIGMDPDPEMLIEAQIQANQAGVGNVKWIEGGSSDLEDMKNQLGIFRLVTIGSSFHWMDQEATLQTLATMIVPSGSIIIVGSSSLWNNTNDWQQAVREVIQKWLGETRRAGNSTYVEPRERFENSIARSPFKRMEEYQLAHQLTWDIDSIMGHLYSTSFCSTVLLGDKRAAFEQDLRKTLLELNQDGIFKEDVLIKALFVWHA
jgi:ubiquinone/menaquinone biosynthesis C-methylase UbiE